MKKTFLPIVLVIALLLSQISVFAFSDMNEERLSWAKTAVNEMAEAGLIKGYEDGSFRPDNSVTKQETLILLSRLVGYTQNSSEKYIKIAEDIYADTLASYSTPYKSEISYLLYKGILTADDLALYVADTEATQPLKRYEAAVLLTKIFEKDLISVEKDEISITFDDLSDIPANAKAYVNYVVKKGIMNGMGENKFMPNEKLTRAMIATLLYRIIPVLDLDYEEGGFLRYDAATSTLRLSDNSGETVTYTVSSDVTSLLDGAKTKLSEFSAGTDVRVTFSGADVILVEGKSSTFETVITGIYNGYKVYEDATAVLIKDAKTGESKEYTISSSITVTKNNKQSSISDLVKSDYISASIKAGKVIHIQAEDKTVTVNGVIDSIVFSPDFAIVINVDGKNVSYDADDDVVVRRNNKVSQLADLIAGDKVKVTTVYGLITEITATSSSVTETGVISEILISNTSSLTLEIDGIETTLFVARNAEISSPIGKTIYDLRLGDTVKISVEGKSITKIDTVSSASTSTNFSGVVESVEPSYGYIKLLDTSTLIFTKGAKVQDSSGLSMNVKGIKPGDSITIFGTSESGAIEATLIIVNK